MRIFVPGALSCVLAAFTACSGHSTTAQGPTTVVVGPSIAKIGAPNLPTDAAPQLVAVSISKDHFGSGDTVTGSAVTSTNVASVEVRVEGYAMPMHRDAFGHFSMKYTLPNLPSFVKRDYQLRVLAINSAGVVAQASLPIHVH